MKNQPKCLIVSSHFRPLVGGALTVYEGLASAKPANFQILTAASDYTTGQIVQDAGNYDDAACFKVYRLPVMRSPLTRPGSWRFFQSFLANLKNRRIQTTVMSEILWLYDLYRFDVICIGSLDALGWLIPVLKDRVPAKLVVYVHGEEVSQNAYSQRAKRARDRALCASEGVIAVSRFTEKMVAEIHGVPRDRVKVLSNGVNLDKFRQRPSENVRIKYNINAGPLVLAVGRLVRRKGFDRLLEAWPKVLAAVPEAQLALVGKGPLEDELHNAAQADVMRGSVHMLGHVPDASLPSLYASADLFAMPNRTMPDGDTEGFGLVFLEAAAAGTPSVGGRAGGAVDAIIDGETGLLVDGDDTGAIAFALTELLTDEVRRLKMADAARQHAMTQGWEDKAAELLAYFDALLDSHGRSKQRD